MTRNEILNQYPQIKTITKLAVSVRIETWLDGSKEKIESYDSKNSVLENKNDFNFVVWRANKSNMGVTLYEGAFVAAYTKEDALHLARILKNYWGDTYSVRKVS